MKLKIGYKKKKKNLRTTLLNYHLRKEKKANLIYLCAFFEVQARESENKD